VFASVVGGLRLQEPAGDLGVCLAVASALLGVPVPADVVVCGEVGLAGEVRQVSQLTRRLEEAARLGFTRAVIPASAQVRVPELEVIGVGSVTEALDAVWIGAAL
jgi:DNA repair protein RadA/Sms